MARIRSNLKHGWLNAASAIDANLGSPDFAKLPQIVTPDYMMITLDPQGAGEVVKVTAHALNSATVTVDRHQEGTTAVAHLAGVAWEHGDTTGDWDLVYPANRITEFAAVGDNASDNALPIQSAINDCRSRRRDLVIPKGDFVFSGTLDATLINDFEIRGEGLDSRLISTTASGNALHIGDPAGFDLGGRRYTLADFVMLSNPTKTGGAAVYADHVQQAYFERFCIDPQTYFPPTNWIGVDINGADLVTVHDCNIVSRWRAIRMNRATDFYLGGGSKISNTATTGALLAGAIGIHVTGRTGGVCLDQSDIIFCDIALQCDVGGPGDTARNGQFFFGPAVTFDSCGDSGVVFRPESATLVHWTGAWSCTHGFRTAASGGGHGLWVDTPNSQLDLSIGGAARIFNSFGDGAVIAAAHTLLVGGGADISGNGLSTAGGTGMLVYPDVAESQIVGAHFCRNGNATRGNGLYLADGVNNYQLGFLMARANGQAGIREPATASNRVQGTGTHLTA